MIGRPSIGYSYVWPTSAIRGRGGDLGGDWGGRSPPKFEVGGRPMHWSPPIFWEAVLSDVRESMKRVKNGVFLVRKWSYTTFNIVNIRKMWGKRKGKLEEPGRWLKKRSSEIFYPENINFSWNWAAKKFFGPPQIRRQVSAHAGNRVIQTCSVISFLFIIQHYFTRRF